MWEFSEYSARRHTRMCGDFSEEMLRTAAALGISRTLVRTPPTNPAVGRPFASRNKYLRLGTKQPLVKLLRALYVATGMGDLQCKDPKDKIYGLLGMAADVAELGIVPDYSKKPDEVFEQVARSLIGTGHLDILKWCRSRRVQSPTWVPDFSTKIGDTWSDEVGVPLFMATGSRNQPTESHSSINRPINPMSISLRGIRLDTVTTVGTVFTYDNDGPFDQMAARKMFTEIVTFLKHPSIYPEASWTDASWRIPICDREQHPTSMFLRRATVEYSQPQYIRICTQHLDEVALTQTNSYRAVMEYRDGARPIRSLEGYVGLGPCVAKPEDIIVFLDGATAPFLLRPAEDVAGCYHLVGEVYLYGVMDGEVVDKGLEEVTFELR